MLPTSKTRTLSIAGVARREVMRSEAVGHAGCAVLSNGQAIQPRLGGAPQSHAPESDAVCGESRFSKRHCVRSRFQNRAEVRKLAVSRCPVSGDLQRSARRVPVAEGVQ